LVSSEKTLQGRAAELLALEKHLGATLARRGGMTLVVGEAGIGKSALVEHALVAAEDRGFSVSTGRAWDSGDAPAYFPLRSGLRALGVTRVTQAAHDADAFALWEDTLEALAHQATRTPLLWLVEDLHAADAQTLELLAFLAQPLRAVSALVLGTIRTGGPTSGPALQRLQRIVGDRRTIEVSRLGEADVLALAARVSGRAIPSATIGEWMTRTGGNPLFVVECARAIRAGRNLETALPETLVDITAERLRALPSETRALLQEGALHGREFQAGALARLTDTLPAIIIEGLLPALRAQLIEEPAPGRFRFVHAVVRDAIEERMPVSDRREGHARLEAALAVGVETTVTLAERARHAIAALPMIAEERAGMVVEQATAALEGEGARDRAFVLWQRWLAARMDKPTAQALLELSRLATAAGNHAEAQRAAHEALALGQLTGDSILRAKAALALGATPQPGSVDRAYVRVLEDTVAHLPSTVDPRLPCLLRARLAAAMQPAADPSVPVAMARGALVEARAIGDESLLREVLVLAGSALMYFVDCNEAHSLAGELLAVSLERGDSARALRAYSRRVVGHLELGDFAAFDDDVERMLALARATGHPSLTWRPLLLGSMRELARGNFDESARLVTEVEELSRLIDDPALALSLRSHKANRTLAIDDERAIRDVLTNEIPDLVRVAGPFGAAVRALFAVRLWDRAAAANEVPALIRIAKYTPPDSNILGLVGEAIALAGTNEEREAMVSKLVPLAGREYHTAPIPMTYEGPILRIMGLLEASLSRLDRATEHLRAARDRCRLLGLRPWTARITLELGRVLARAGRVDEARMSFQDAAHLAAELRMGHVEAGARAALQRGVAELSVVPIRPLPRTQFVEKRGLMLEREGEVWKVAWGTNLVRIKDSRGVQLLAKLVASPDERIHVLALAGDGEAPLPETHAGEASDGKAIAAYRARLRTIDEALTAAEGRDDRARYDTLRREREMLVAEISRAVGLGGRLRKVGSATERARINVTRRVREAVARIVEADAAMGRHLEQTIQTGTYCSYRSGEK
jgi:tetratricopeptide (TPR) repeat protein